MTDMLTEATRPQLEELLVEAVVWRGAVSEVAGVLGGTVDDLRDPWCRRILGTALALHRNDRPVDPLTIIEQLDDATTDDQRRMFSLWRPDTDRIADAAIAAVGVLRHREVSRQVALELGEILEDLGDHREVTRRLRRALQLLEREVAA